MAELFAGLTVESPMENEITYLPPGDNEMVLGKNLEDEGDIFVLLLRQFILESMEYFPELFPKLCRCLRSSKAVAVAAIRNSRRGNPPLRFIVIHHSNRSVVFFMDFELAEIKFMYFTIFGVVVIKKFKVGQRDYFVVVALIQDYSSRLTAYLMSKICRL
jgi:hypothetical protein